MHKIQIKVLQVLVSPPINKALIGFMGTHSSNTNNTNYQVTLEDRIDGANTDGAKIETSYKTKPWKAVGCLLVFSIRVGRIVSVGLIPEAIGITEHEISE